jgi:carboxymethylenebutenolidase
MGTELTARHLQLDTGEGSMSTYVVHPAEGGPHPVVLFLMDAPGKRPLLHAMADRIAANGYYVMLPNLFYRMTPAFELDFASTESFERMRELMYAVSNAMVARDAAQLFAFADADPAAHAADVGCVGYCMSGPFSLWVAAEHADRVRAAASFYGVRLHVDKHDSPHLRLGEVTGEVYVGAAEFDDYVPLEMIDRLEAAMQAAGTRGRVERYWGLHHGFAFDDRPAYDADGDRRHWEVLLDLFDRTLHGHTGHGDTGHGEGGQSDDGRSNDGTGTA